MKSLRLRSSDSGSYFSEAMVIVSTLPHSISRALGAFTTRQKNLIPHSPWFSTKYRPIVVNNAVSVRNFVDSSSRTLLFTAFTPFKRRYKLENTRFTTYSEIDHKVFCAFSKYKIPRGLGGLHFLSHHPQLRNSLKTHNHLIFPSSDSSFDKLYSKKYPQSSSYFLYTSALRNLPLPRRATEHPDRLHRDCS